MYSNHRSVIERKKNCASKYLRIYLQEITFVVSNQDINYINGFDTAVFSIKFTWHERSVDCIFFVITIVFVLKLLL